MEFFNRNFITVLVKKKRKERHVKQVNEAVTLWTCFFRCVVQNSAETSAVLRLIVASLVL